MYFSKVVAPVVALFGVASAGPQAKRSNQVANAYNNWVDAVNSFAEAVEASNCDWPACISSCSASAAACSAAAAELGLNPAADLACIAAVGATATEECRQCFW
ncbi:hypothetical protein AJ78_08702 [Emergomyces pasteurianus Ep9510]|uniref:Fungal calcium binding protein domain-containing protein n=1 Tax=Emergomyces pasteurianus Ep9510 TaxID=1447872 RepID=A0A1J9P1G8_9EURO|nr:hypothetical protein AJ78_08702 [Emergomyces pasteurianus Ep9510]